MQYTYSYTLLIHIPISKRIGGEKSEHCLWFLLCSKSSMLCSIPIVILYLYIYPYQNVLVMKLRALSLVSTMLRIEYAMQYTYSYTLLIHIPILKRIGDETQSIISGFCYAQNQVCYAVYHEYRYLLNDLTSKYHHIKFANLSIGSLGIFGQSCDSLIQMCSDLTIDKAHTNYIITKLSTIIIRTTYYIFCMRNKPWTNPDLLSY